MSLKCHSYQDCIKWGSRFWIWWMNTASLVLFLGGGLDSISATKYTEEVLHLPQVSHYCSSTVAWKMRMLKGKETVLLHSALDVWESKAGKLCFSLPAYYCSCLPIASVIIYSYANETWVILLSIHWTASGNIDFSLLVNYLSRGLEVGWANDGICSKIQEINDD